MHCRFGSTCMRKQLMKSYTEAVTKFSRHVFLTVRKKMKRGPLNPAFCQRQTNIKQVRKKKTEDSHSVPVRRSLTASRITACFSAELSPGKSTKDCALDFRDLLPSCTWRWNLCLLNSIWSDPRSIVHVCGSNELPKQSKVLSRNSDL